MSEPTGPEEPPKKRTRLEESRPIPQISEIANSATPRTNLELKDEPSSANASPKDSELEKETRAGVTEYVCPENLGFTAILKQRYTDFLVNEILLNGKVLHLTSTGIGRDKRRDKDVSISTTANGTDSKTGEAVEKPTHEPAQEEVVKENGRKSTDANKEKSIAGNGETTEAEPELSPEHLQTLHTFYGETTTSEILSLIKAINQNPSRKARDFRPVTSASPIPDKEQRTKAHQCLREIFPYKLESSTGPNNTITIRPVPPLNRGSKRKREENDGEPRSRGKLSWEELGGEYLHFTLYKENKDTMEVVNFLGSTLKVGPKNFQFAGTKDRRAATVQRLCAKRVRVDQLAPKNEMLRNAVIGDFQYQKHGLGLGDLAGNEFVITLRDAHFEGEEGLYPPQRAELATKVVSQAVTDFAAKGFINYFGLQRFGSFAASTDTVGVKLLQGNLKGAIDDILSFSPLALIAAESDNADESTKTLISSDDRARAKALHVWQTTQNSEQATRTMPRKFSAETAIIRHLGWVDRRTKQCPRENDYQGALMQIPRNLRLMYVHAYQSFVWNVVAGRRWTEFGERVVEGDLVLVREHLDKVKGDAKGEGKQEVDQDGEVVINPSGDDSAVRVEDTFERARPLTKEEAESGDYTIFDIVLPLPGFDVEYPHNTIGEFYKEFMGSERGGGLDPHDMRRKWRDISLSGSYRKVLAKPLRGLEFKIREYTAELEKFVETDLEKVQKAANEDKRGGDNGTNVGKDSDAEMKDAEEDSEMKKIAVVLKMQLGTAQYATMALRELMKAGGVKTYKPEFLGGRDAT